MARKPQIEMLKKQKNSYGGELYKKRAGRSSPRPLDTKNTMHLILRSSKAVGDWSFKKPENEKSIREILNKFSVKYGVKILSAANVGNHIHIQFQLRNRFTYKPFIRAVTSAIATAVTGINRWTKITDGKRLKFWDYRPFTRVVQSYRAFLNLRDYIRINVLEGFGVGRDQGRLIVKAGVYVGASFSSA
jgi:hypothetical protein